MKIKSVSLLVCAHAATDLSQGALPVLLPFFIIEHHITYAAAAAMVFAANLISTVAQPIVGHIADRHPRPWLMPIAMIVAAVGISFTGVAPAYWMSVVSVMLCGLGIAVFHPEGARMMKYLAGERQATAMSLFAIGGQFGFAIGPIIATAFLLLWGLKGATCLIVPIGLVAVLVMLKMPGLSAGYETMKGGHNNEKSSAGKDMWPAFICLSTILLCRSVIFYGLNTFLPLFWIDVLHQSKAAGGTALTILLISAITGNFLGGRTADRFGYKIVPIVAFSLLTVMLPFLIFIENAVWATALLIPIGFAFSAPFGPLVVLGQQYLPNRIGLSSGITLGLSFSFGGLVTPLLGWIGDHHGLRATITVLALLPIVSMCLSLFLPAAKRDK